MCSCLKKSGGDYHDYLRIPFLSDTSRQVNLCKLQMIKRGLQRNWRCRLYEDISGDEHVCGSWADTYVIRHFSRFGTDVSFGLLERNDIRLANGPGRSV